MAKQPMRGLTAAMLGHGELDPEPAAQAAVTAARPSATTSSIAQTVALTLKVSPALYQRLKFLGVRRRQSNQTILQAALVEYLDREEGTG